MAKTRAERPVTLPLPRLRLPLPGWVSLLHRVSGVLLFFSLPLAIYVFQQSLLGADSFEQIRQQLMAPWARLLLLLAVWALAHHLFAGIRHLLMDVHWGVRLASARRSALLVVLAGGLVAVVTAWRLFA